MSFLDDVELELYDDEDEPEEDNSESHRLLDHYGEGAYDITEDVIEYPNGKVFDCPCGHPHGVFMEDVASKCYSCMEYTLVDTRARERPIDDDETRKSRVGDGSNDSMAVGDEEESNEEGEGREEQDEENSDVAQTGLGDWV